MRILLVFLFLCVTFIGISQEEIDSIKVEEITDTKSLFSGKDTLFTNESDTLSLKRHKEATLIDSLWLNELIKSPLYC